MAAGLSVIAIVVLARIMGPSAHASDPNAMDAMRLDMDPANTPANTATSIGSNETCARINENDILDADEDGTADQLDIDLTALNIPPDTPMQAFNSQLRFDELVFTMQTSNVRLLLNANAGSNIFDASDPTPDTNGDNVFNWSVLDIGTGAGESGSGVLARGGFSTDPGAQAGLYQIDMAGMVHIDTTNNAWFANNTNWDSDADTILDGLQPAAFVAINQACPDAMPTPIFTPTPPGIIEESVTSVPSPSGGPANPSTGTAAGAVAPAPTPVAPMAGLGASLDASGWNITLAVLGTVLGSVGAASAGAGLLLTYMRRRSVAKGAPQSRPLA